jgi:hypothetical protein
MSGTTQSSSGGKAAFIGVAVILAVTVLPIWFFFIGPQLRHDRLEKNGVRANGRLINVDETGTVVNDSPELELTVEYTRADGTLDTAVTDFVPSRRSLHMFQNGVAVKAAYDPEDFDEITVLELGGSPMQIVSTPNSTPTPSSDATVDSLRRALDSLRREVESLKGR